MNYIAWALTGMASYSLVTLFVKLATRSGRFSGFFVLAISTVIVVAITLGIAFLRGDLRAIKGFTGREAVFICVAGIFLAVAVSSLFQALSKGPASVVVPLYGMFIVGGALLGMIFLGEPVSARKLIGLGLAAASIYLIAGNKP